MKFGFKIKEKNKKIIVIPVNDAFDTIVETVGETIVKPLVTPNSIHGFWIKNFCNQMKIDINELNDRIQKNLRLQNIKPAKTYSRVEKNKGNLDSYPIGTIAVISGNNNTEFYLLVISIFDQNNNSKSSKRAITDAVDSLIEFYGITGQGFPIFMPLMGTGSSRAGLTHLQSLRVIKSCILTSEEKINGYMNVMVYTGDKDKVSIFD